MRMFIPTVLAILAFALSSCGSSSSAEPAEPAGDDARFEQELREAINPVVEGLADAHRSELPALELEICIPAVERGDPPSCHRDRVYADGARYLLTTESWFAVRPVSPEGMAALGQLYGEVCDGVDPVFGNDTGSEIHLVHFETCHARLVVTGIPSGRLARLRDVPTLLQR